MSVSIYYAATRPEPLTQAERFTVDSAIAKYAVEDQTDTYCETGQGLNWESFCVYDPDAAAEPTTVFEGATKLPDNSDDAMWTGIRHWCSLLTEIRNALPGASWEVSVDDHDIVWDDVASVYDPSR